MRHLKLFESFSEKDIDAICKKYRIENYTINEDGSIDVRANVNFRWKDIYELPLKFRNVTGYFDCSVNYLTSLEGFPESVGGDFSCFENELISLEGCTKYVGRNFHCRNNNIISFEHLPLSIGGGFFCNHNPIYNIWELFEDYSKIEFLNYCDPIREPDVDSEEPIIILDRLNYFLEEIGKKPVTNVKGYKCI